MPIRDIAIAASAGGVETLGDIVMPLPADLPAALLIVMHVRPRRAFGSLSGRE
ncbi:MAG TPA: chemotaxis protein CheB [Candidatus Binataceae bacterium]|nr:chemotaxis protein CheB [Candidatus Binataceae bacterium]